MNIVNTKKHEVVYVKAEEDGTTFGFVRVYPDLWFGDDDDGEYATLTSSFTDELEREYQKTINQYDTLFPVGFLFVGHQPPDWFTWSHVAEYGLGLHIFKRII